MILLLFIPALMLLLIPAVSLVLARNSPLFREQKKLSEGIHLFTTCRYQEAFAYFDSLIRDGRHNCLTFYYRGLCQTRQGNPNSALFDFTTALSYDNSLPEIYLERGKIYLASGDVDRALYEFERSVFYAHGKRADVLRYRGIALIEKGRYFQAARFLNRAVELGDEEANHLLMTPPFQNSFGLSRDPSGSY